MIGAELHSFTSPPQLCHRRLSEIGAYRGRDILVPFTAFESERRLDERANNKSWTLGRAVDSLGRGFLPFLQNDDHCR